MLFDFIQTVNNTKGRMNVNRNFFRKCIMNNKKKDVFKILAKSVSTRFVL